MNSTSLCPGWILVARDQAFDPGVWFVFYHEDIGTAAFDITTEHPSIHYQGFETALNFKEIKPETEKMVLLGGPERPDNALIILHETGASTDSTHINDDFSFQGYTYILVPGKPPTIATADNAPTKIVLKPRANFLVVMGYRTWEGTQISTEIASGKWICLPADRKIIFETNRAERREKILNQIN
jgi:putative AlgH/UPF0301 family transcriptional regulator